MYFTLYGRYPFDGNNVREILLTVLHGTIEWESDEPRLGVRRARAGTVPIRLELLVDLHQKLLNKTKNGVPLKI